MKGLGMYSGRIYDKYGDKSEPIRECIVPLPDEQAESCRYVFNKYNFLHSAWCADCTLCTLSRLDKQKESNE